MHLSWTLPTYQHNTVVNPVWECHNMPGADFYRLLPHCWVHVGHAPLLVDQNLSISLRKTEAPGGSIPLPRCTIDFAKSSETQEERGPLIKMLECILTLLVNLLQLLISFANSELPNLLDRSYLINISFSRETAVTVVRSCGKCTKLNARVICELCQLIEYLHLPTICKYKTQTF